MRTLAWLLGLSLSMGSIPAAAQSEPITNRIEGALDALRPPVEVAGRAYSPRSVIETLEIEKVPGVSITIIDQGRIAWTGSFGVADVETGRKVTSDTVFQAASISKPVAASGALLLAEQGKLSLDRPVNDQLTAWRLPDHVYGGEPVTLRRLLGHTAGLTVWGFPGYASGLAVPTVPEILDGTPPANTNPVRVEWAPGSKWQYSGGGITIAQLMMSEAEDKAFPELMENLVLSPMGMSRSTYQQPLPTSRANEAAFGHTANGETIPGGFHTYPELAAAGLWTHPTDLAKWALTISRAFLGQASGVLKRETAQAMLTPGMGDWGLGVRVDGEGEWFKFSHNGSNAGYRAAMIMYPRKQQGIVVMTNGDNGGRVLQSVTQAVGRMFGWPGQEPRTITPATVSQSALAARVGHYEGSVGSLYVALAGDHLVAVPAARDEPKFELIPQSDGSYVSPNNNVRVEFKTDPRTGEVTSISAGAVVLRRK